MLVQAINALTACFKGLSPSDNDIFDLADMEDDGSDKQDAVDAIRRDALMIALRTRIERSVAGVVRVWSGDGEVADVSKDERIPGQADTIQAISSLVKHSTLSSSDTLISLSPLPLLTLVCGAAERFPSALWMYLASTLTSRISVPPSPLTRNKDRTPDEATQHSVEDEERWNVIADAAGRLVVVASGMLGGIGVRDVTHLSNEKRTLIGIASGFGRRLVQILLSSESSTFCKDHR